jgi:hypothetical protein
MRVLQRLLHVEDSVVGVLQIHLTKEPLEE